jgi:hypothetical protein
MKNFLKKLAFLVLISVCLSSCYVNTFSVGKGAQTGIKVRKTNNYLFGGLVPMGNADPKTMAAGAENYDVKIKHGFGCLLIGGFTGGIYTPTVTIVTK